MCGVIGFFVGCELSKTCLLDEPCKLFRNVNALRSWYENASVRRSPRRLMTEADVQMHFFPERLAPVTQHPLVKSRDGEVISDILTNHLCRYLDFTYRLELVVVNDVSKDIALAQTAFTPSHEIRHDALKIYCDEGYHALFSYDLLSQVQSLTGKAAILPEVPYFLRRLQSVLMSCETEFERRLLKLFFVVVSETLITSSLLDLRKDPTLPVAIRDLVIDHASDEARHHAFFAGLMFSIWGTFNRETRILCLQRIPEFIFAFVHPDKPALTSELVSVGISRGDAEQIIEETYPAYVINKYARECSSVLIGHLRQLDEFYDASVADVFYKSDLYASSS